MFSQFALRKAADQAYTDGCRTLVVYGWRMHEQRILKASHSTNNA